MYVYYPECKTIPSGELDIVLNKRLPLESLIVGFIKGKLASKAVGICGNKNKTGMKVIILDPIPFLILACDDPRHTQQPQYQLLHCLLFLP